MKKKSLPILAIIILIIALAVVLVGGRDPFGKFTAPFQGSGQGVVANAIPVLAGVAILMTLIIFFVVYIVMKWFT